MKSRGPKLIAYLAAAVVATANAQARPEPLQGGTLVTYMSAQPDSKSVSISATLFKPTGSAKGAVVVINGSSGPTDSREGQYARAFGSAGYAVLTIDTFGPRGVVNTQEDNTLISTDAQAHDVLAARRYMVSVGYPADRMAVLGSGRGGTIALLVADRTFVKDDKERFAAAMAVGAACVFHPKTPKPASRVFMAVGEKDDVAGVQSCKDFSKEFATAGGLIEVKVYPGAGSGFDGNPVNLGMHRNPFIETFVDCHVLVETDGRSIYNGKSFAESDTTGLLTEMRKSCIKRGGFAWTNLTQKATVTLDLIEFLDKNFRR